MDSINVSNTFITGSIIKCDKCDYPTITRDTIKATYNPCTCRSCENWNGCGSGGSYIYEKVKEQYCQICPIKIEVLPLLIDMINRFLFSCINCNRILCEYENTKCEKCSLVLCIKCNKEEVIAPYQYCKPCYFGFKCSTCENKTCKPFEKLCYKCVKIPNYCKPCKTLKLNSTIDTYPRFNHKLRIDYYSTKYCCPICDPNFITTFSPSYIQNNDSINIPKTCEYCNTTLTTSIINKTINRYPYNNYTKLIQCDKCVTKKSNECRYCEKERVDSFSLSDLCVDHITEKDVLKNSHSSMSRNNFNIFLQDIPKHLKDLST